MPPLIGPGPQVDRSSTVELLHGSAQAFVWLNWYWEGKHAQQGLGLVQPKVPVEQPIRCQAATIFVPYLCLSGCHHSVDWAHITREIAEK